MAVKSYLVVMVMVVCVLNAGAAHAEGNGIFGNIFQYLFNSANYIASYFHIDEPATVYDNSYDSSFSENTQTNEDAVTTPVEPSAFTSGSDITASQENTAETIDGATENALTETDETDFASEITTTETGIRIEHQSFFSRSLGKTKKYNILLPPNYETSQKQYPVVYLLNGLFGSEDQWIKDGNIIKTYQNLLSDNKIGEIIIVMPDGDNSAYENGCSGSVIFSCGRYEDYIIRDLIDEIDSQYRTLPSREYRAIGGLSLGARGAMRIVFLHPQLFSAVAGHSGKYSYLIGEMTDTNWEALKNSGTSIYFDHSKNDLIPGYLSSSRELDMILTQKGIVHEYREIDFSTLHSHDWPFWRQQVAVALQKECKVICLRSAA